MGGVELSLSYLSLGRLLESLGKDKRRNDWRSIAGHLLHLLPCMELFFLIHFLIFCQVPLNFFNVFPSLDYWTQLTEHEHQSTFPDVQQISLTKILWFIFLKKCPFQPHLKLTNYGQEKQAVSVFHPTVPSSFLLFVSDISHHNLAWLEVLDVSFSLNSAAASPWWLV